jgi:hypothetical protein
VDVGSLCVRYKNKDWLERIWLGFWYFGLGWMPYRILSFTATLMLAVKAPVELSVSCPKDVLMAKPHCHSNAWNLLWSLLRQGFDRSIFRWQQSQLDQKFHGPVCLKLKALYLRHFAMKFTYYRAPQHTTTLARDLLGVTAVTPALRSAMILKFTEDTCMSLSIVILYNTSFEFQYTG